MRRSDGRDFAPSGLIRCAVDDTPRCASHSCYRVEVKLARVRLQQPEPPGCLLLLPTSSARSAQDPRPASASTSTPPPKHSKTTNDKPRRRPPSHAANPHRAPRPTPPTCRCSRSADARSACGRASARDADWRPTDGPDIQRRHHRRNAGGRNSHLPSALPCWRQTPDRLSARASRLRLRLPGRLERAHRRRRAREHSRLCQGRCVEAAAATAAARNRHKRRGADVPRVQLELATSQDRRCARGAATRHQHRV